MINIQRLKNYLENKNNCDKMLLFLSGVTVISPIVDLIIGVLFIQTSKIYPIGVLFRGATLSVVLIYLLFMNKLKKTDNPYILHSMLLFVVVRIIISAFFLNTGLVSEIIDCVKFFYTPILLYSMVVIYNKEGKYITQKTLAVSILLYAVLIIMALATGTGTDSYSYLDKIGSDGWFYSANEIGTIFAVSFPLLYLYIINKSKIPISYKILTLLSIVFASMYIGTKVPFLAILITIIVLFLLRLIKELVKNFEVTGFLIAGFVILASINFILPYSPIGFNLGMGVQMSNPYQSSIQDTTNNDKELEMLSGRNLKLSTVAAEYKKANAYKKLFGLGSRKNKDYELSIEMDMFDIFFNYGILGFAIYFWIFILIVIGFIKKIFHKNAFLRENVIAIIISTGLAFGIGATAGHTFSSPAVGLYVAISFGYMYINSKNKVDDYDIV